MEPFEVTVITDGLSEKWSFEELVDAIVKFKELMEDADLCDSTITLKANPV